MTEEPQTPDTPAPAAPPAAPTAAPTAAPVEQPWTRIARSLSPAMVVAVIALLLGVWQWSTAQRDATRLQTDLARRLGTNSGHLSRALNDGHGGFADAVARIRAERVAARIDAGESGDLLGLALEAGFGSKASFNRAFKAETGLTPTEFRRTRLASSAGASGPTCEPGPATRA